MCVCVCVCVCVYGLAICCWWAKHQGWPGSSLRTPLHPQVGWQATLMTLDGTQTLVASPMTELHSRGASEWDLVLLLGNSGKVDLDKDQDDGGIALEKGYDQTVGEQWEHHLFCWKSVWRLDENFEVYRQQQLEVNRQPWKMMNFICKKNFWSDRTKSACIHYPQPAWWAC